MGLREFLARLTAYVRRLFGYDDEQSRIKGRHHCFVYSDQLCHWQLRLQRLAEQGWGLDTSRVDRLLWELAHPNALLETQNAEPGPQDFWITVQAAPDLADLDPETATVEDLKRLMLALTTDGNTEPDWKYMSPHPCHYYCRYCADLAQRVADVRKWTLEAESYLTRPTTLPVRDHIRAAVTHAGNIVRRNVELREKKQRTNPQSDVHSAAQNSDI